jgi:tetratricopeptide (TPR) repeat protein
VGRNEEAIELCDKIENSHLNTKVKELKAAIHYEKNDFQKAMAEIQSISNADYQTLINEGCVFFKLEQHDKAIAKFKEATKLCGFNAELFYNIALTYYEMGIFSEAYFYLDTIIRKAYDQYPKLKLISPDSPIFEKDDKQLAQQILRETAIVEALNLKSSILYNQGDRTGASELAKCVPVIQLDSGPDPVTFHNLAVYSANEYPEEALQKLASLLTNSMFPPETL